MVNALLRWLLSMLAVALAAYLLDGISYESLISLAFAALVLGILNAILRPVLMILSLPFIIVTLGLFLLVINALTLWLTGLIVPGFEVVGFWTALLGGLIISLVNLFTGEKKSKVEVKTRGRKPKDDRRSGPPPGKGPVIDI
jgi:putative membrane protein